MARAEIEETSLPGVGVRYAFEADDGRRISVIQHHSGRREVFVSTPEDPDTARQVLSLSDEDSRIVAELLGVSRVVREIDRLQQSVAGLTIEWLPIEEGTRAAGSSVGDLEIRSETGVTVIAALREGRTLPVPGPDFRLRAGDTVVVLGDAGAIRDAQELLRG